MPRETVDSRPIPPPARRKSVVRVVHSPDRAAIGRIFALDGTAKHRIGAVVVDPGAIDDRRLSGAHFELRPAQTAGKYVVEDLGSKNGTMLNGRRISTVDTLSANDVIAAGDTLLVVDQEPDPHALRVSPRASAELASDWIGVSLTSERVRLASATAAASEKPVLLLGPTGAGKEVAARAIHRASERANGPFEAMNCAAVPTNTAELELFGSRPGAFTGAVVMRGRFAKADGGTLFLDEIGDLDAVVQPKLLRALEDKEIQPLGPGPAISVNVRFIGATRIDLESSGFRVDLYARLSDRVLRLPGLADRRADILVLWDHFAAKRLGAEEPPARTAELSEALLLYAWPRNVRELMKLAEQAVESMEPGAPLDLHLLPGELQRPLHARAGMLDDEGALEPEADGDEEERDRPTKSELIAALKRAHGNVTRVAKDHGWHRNQVNRWLKRYGINPDDFRG
jgi:DNA-binding NtrC family response regulator